MMKISVIVPCFNAAKTLSHQLDALSNQVLSTLKSSDWEIILVDNSSRDQSLAIAYNYQARLPNLEILSASERQSAAYARNVGARAAKGTFLAFCDADDIVSLTWVEAIFEALSAHDFVASRFDYHRLKGFSTVQEHHLQGFRPKFLPHAGGCGIGIRAAIHASVGGFDEDLRFLEDLEYCLKVQVAGYPLVYAHQALLHVRQRQQALDGFRQAQKWGEYFPLICKRYESYGLAKLSLWVMIKTYLGVGVRFFQSCLRGDRQTCLWEIGWRWGYLIGCFRHRSMQFVELVS